MSRSDRRARAARSDPRTAPTQSEPRSALLSASQALVAFWLLASPVVFPGPTLLAAKDVVIGGLLLALTVAGAARSGTNGAQPTALVVLGLVLVSASLLLETATGAAAAARQWNGVGVGVLLVCLAAARAR